MAPHGVPVSPGGGCASVTMGEAEVSRGDCVAVVRVLADPLGDAEGLAEVLGRALGDVLRVVVVDVDWVVDAGTLGGVVVTGRVVRAVAVAFVVAVALGAVALGAVVPVAVVLGAAVVARDVATGAVLVGLFVVFGAGSKGGTPPGLSASFSFERQLGPALRHQPSMLPAGGVRKV